MIRPTTKERLHPRNRFRSGYDFPALVKASPGLAPFVRANVHGGLSIEYSDPAAVKALNRALLAATYGIHSWDIPAGYLCPPIPGRSDLLHHLADLLSGGDDTAIPRGPGVRVLDVGVGANCIYPLIGASEYGWSFVGSEIDGVALRVARENAGANPRVSSLIECREQPAAAHCFAGVAKPGERFSLSLCNPPFHASEAEAAAGARRKVNNLRGKPSGKAAPVALNFGGKEAELWCAGGELGFIRRMIAESATMPALCRWFTCLVSRSEHLPTLYRLLEDTTASEVKTIAMAQGQKKTRILAWRFA